MSKYVLIPDSFKGTLSSADICRIAAEEILRLEPSAEVCAIPVADGGEGTVDAFLAAVGGRRIEAPWYRPVGRAGNGALRPAAGRHGGGGDGCGGGPAAGGGRLRPGKDDHLRRGAADGPCAVPRRGAAGAGAGRQRHQRWRLRRRRSAGGGISR